MTVTGNEAFDAMLAHHRVLDESVAHKAQALGEAVTAGSPHEPALADLVAYLAGEVLPHALAEEHTLYQAGASREDLGSTVAEMVAEHRSLATAVEGLAQEQSGTAAAERAGEVVALFGTHVAKENEVLLPALAADGNVDLARLLVQMHRLTEAAEEPPAGGEEPVSDPEASLTSLLLEATAVLARAGEGDRACRLAAAAWASLRVARPELAVRVTAALHRLVQSVTPEPVALLGADDLGGPGDEPDLDVRELAPARRHEVIFTAYGALRSGAAFVLVNDHDPKPLRYQFEAEHAGQFTWCYLEEGPTVWRVRIGRPVAAP